MVDAYKYIVGKYKIDVGSQYIVDIPNIGRDDMAKLFSEMNFNEGAEIGVELGLYSETLLKANPELKLYCIDPWKASAYDLDAGIHGIDTEQRKYDQRYRETLKRLRPYNAKVIRKTSKDALSMFKDESLDFVYIDGNHDFPNFVHDLHEWTKKVKTGGIVSGHDYANFSFKKHNHVKRSLDAYARSYRMIPLFIAGSYEAREGEIRDKYRSWFWVKA